MLAQEIYTEVNDKLEMSQIAQQQMQASTHLLLPKQRVGQTGLGSSNGSNRNRVGLKAGLRQSACFALHCRLTATKCLQT